MHPIYAFKQEGPQGCQATHNNAGLLTIIFLEIKSRPLLKLQKALL